VTKDPPHPAKSSGSSDSLWDKAKIFSVPVLCVVGFVVFVVVAWNKVKDSRDEVLLQDCVKFQGCKYILLWARVKLYMYVTVPILFVATLLGLKKETLAPALGILVIFLVQLGMFIWGGAVVIGTTHCEACTSSAFYNFAYPWYIVDVVCMSLLLIASMILVPDAPSLLFMCCMICADD